MAKLDGLDMADLQSALDDVETAKAAKRLVVALAYMDGVDVTVISDRYDIPQSTIYYWLDRFEEQPLAEALEDEPRPGRPSKLTPDQRAAVESWLDDPPDATDGDAAEWTAKRLQQRIEDEFGVEYSIPHVHRTFIS